MNNYLEKYIKYKKKYINASNKLSQFGAGSCKSHSHFVICNKCNGSKKINDDKCTNCNGSGRISVSCNDHHYHMIGALDRDGNIINICDGCGDSTRDR